MIRIVHILPFTGVGGTEQMVLNLCKFRDQKEFECVVTAPAEGVIIDEIRKTGTPVYTERESYNKVMRWADLINLHLAHYPPNLHALVQTSRKPFVVTLHWMSEMPKLPVYTICTSFHAYEIQKYKSQSMVIPNGIDLSVFAPRPRQRREVVNITRICRPVRCDLYFWTAMRKVLSRYPQTRLWIVGNENGIGRSSDRVRFFGIRRDIQDILAETDIFAYTPYPNSGSSDLVVMEASAMGVTCVTSDVNCVREALEQGQNGFLTPFGDVDAFTRKVGMLVEDADLRSRMSQTAIRIARERFDMHRVAWSYEAVYRMVLDAYHRNVRR